MTKPELLIQALTPYLEAHTLPSGQKKSAATATTLLFFLSDEVNLLSQKDAIINILDAIKIGTHPHSVTELYETLDLITNDHRLAPEVISAMNTAEINPEYVQRVITNLYVNRDVLCSQTVDDDAFQTSLEKKIGDSLKIAHTSDVRATVASQIVTQSLELVKESYTEGLDIVKQMYSKRDAVRGRRVEVAVALLFTALSVVNAAGAANLAAVGLSAFQDGHTIDAVKIVQSVSILINSLHPAKFMNTLDRTREITAISSDPNNDLITLSTLALNIVDSLAGVRREIHKSQTAYSEENVNAYIQQMTLQAIELCSNLYENYEEVSCHLVENAVKKNLKQNIKATQDLFEHANVGIGHSVTTAFAEQLTEQIDSEFRHVSNVHMDPTIHFITSGAAETRREVIAGIKLYALINIYSKGKFDGKIPKNELHTLEDWHLVREALAKGSLHTDTADSTDAINNTLRSNFAELRGASQDRFAYGKRLPLLNTVQREWCRNLREGWVTAQGQANAFITSKSRLSPYSLNVSEWCELLSESIGKSLPYVISRDFTNKSAVFGVTSATLVVSSPLYRQAFEHSLKRYEHFQELFRKIAGYPKDQQQAEMLNLQKRLEAAGIVIKSSVKETLDLRKLDLESLADTMENFNNECCDVLKACTNRKQVKTLINLMSDHIIILNELDPSKAQESLDRIITEIMDRINERSPAKTDKDIKDFKNLLTVLNREGIRISDMAHKKIISAMTNRGGTPDTKLESLLQENIDNKEVSTKNPLHGHTMKYKACIKELRDPDLDDSEKTISPGLD